MPTDFTISDHYITQFTGNVELLLQQKQPRLLGCVNSSGYRGEKAQVVKQFGDVAMSPVNPGADPGRWRGDTVLDDIEHYNRWVFPGDYKVALGLAEEEELRQLNDPRSPYAEAMRAAYARLADDVIIAAATNDAKTGRYDDLVNTVFPDEQIIEYDFKYAAADPDAAGLSLGKLIKAKEMLIAANNDPNEPRYLACSERQLSDLLRTTEVRSADYNSIKALVQGEVDTFMGFKFISTERLLSTAADGAVPLIRHCFAWVRSGLQFGTWKGLQTFVDRRPDKNYIWQIYMKTTIGATRTQEKKLVQINCAE